jgi:predicted DNA-binding protein (MmcQ/YjbR family)
MDVEILRDYALSLGEVEEGFPFGPTALVFKANGKMFLLISLESNPLSMNVKCDPEKALQWREAYASVTPGYHMNKKHWNTVVLDGSLRMAEVREMIQDSYNLVTKKKGR